jgi:hypothetical protein
MMGRSPAALYPTALYQPPDHLCSGYGRTCHTLWHLFDTELSEEQVEIDHFLNSGCPGRVFKIRDLSLDAALRLVHEHGMRGFDQYLRAYYRQAVDEHCGGSPWEFGLHRDTLAVEEKGLVGRRPRRT